MDIVKKSSRNGSYFVFSFIDEKDRDFWFKQLERCVNNSPDKGVAEELRDILSRLVHRTDDKYATKQYAFTGMLFPGEFIRFAQATALLMLLYNSVVDEAALKRMTKDFEKYDTESSEDESDDEYAEDEEYDDDKAMADMLDMMNDDSASSDEE